MANYFNTLKKKLLYNSYIQAVFNYPMEWMNLFCCWFREPKDVIKEIDFRYCVCDSFFLMCLQILGWIILIAIIIIIILFTFVGAALGGSKGSSSNDKDERERREIERMKREEEERRRNACEIF